MFALPADLFPRLAHHRMADDGTAVPAQAESCRP
jgi:hypothetical protein